MQPISDNLEFLFALSGEGRFSEVNLETLIGDGIIELEALSYIRGRSIPNQFIIVDEAQNLTPHEIKTIVTRAGIGTKIIITGDPYQIDNPYLDSCSNGLTYLVERFKGVDTFGHVTFIKGERSPLAELAAELLE
jgi:PhoH-like ATPase